MFVDFFVRSSVSKAVGPFRRIEAPTRYPEAPKNYNPEKWFEYLIICRYISHCRHNRIGWHTPRLVAWICLMSVSGILVLSVLSGLGIEVMNDLQYALICLGGLLLALTHGYAHNSGRRHGLQGGPVPVLVFVKAFSVPIVLSIAMLAFALGKHHMLGLAWKILPIT